MKFTNGKGSGSSTAFAKHLIRKEIFRYYDDIDTVIRNANNYSYNENVYGTWNKCSNLVDAGSFACYFEDQAKMLEPIYGKEKVDKWFCKSDRNGQCMIHTVYRGLIGRECAKMKELGINNANDLANYEKKKGFNFDLAEKQGRSKVE